MNAMTLWDVPENVGRALTMMTLRLLSPGLLVLSFLLLRLLFWLASCAHIVAHNVSYSFVLSGLAHQPVGFGLCHVGLSSCGPSFTQLP
jgi:hypothetical protein